VARLRLDGYPVALFEVDVGAVAVEAASGVLEAHFDEVAVVVGHVAEPVETGEVAASCGAVAAGVAAALDALVVGRLSGGC